MMTEQPNQENQPAGALSTEKQPIPYDRFQDVVGQKNAEKAEKEALQSQLAQLLADQQQQKDAELTEQNRYQELAESRGVELEAANIKAGRVDELEAIMLQTLKAQIENIPENMRDFVPSHGTPQERLAWINENAAKLAMPQAPDMDGGAGGNTKPEKKIELSQGERHLTAQARAYGFNIESESVGQRKKK